MNAPPTGDDKERFWHDYLTRGDAMERRVRRIFRVLPHGPRCQLCAAPFAGAVAPVMRALGKRPADKNPRVCQSCFTFMAKHHGGAEIEASFMFADIRGSTTLAERMPTAEFHALLDRFYAAAIKVVFEHDGGVDKFVGDEVVAMYFPLISGPRHTALAVETAEALLRATGHEDPDGPWVPVGRGSHRTGMGRRRGRRRTHRAHRDRRRRQHHRPAGFGRRGRGGPGSASAADAAGLDPALVRNALELKGKESPTEVVSLRVLPPSDRRASAEEEH